MWEAYIEGWRKYFNISGRTSRRDYWFFTVMAVLVFILTYYADFFLGTLILSPTAVAGQAEEPFGIINSIYLIAILIPNLTITIRRLHDIGKSAVWLVLLLIPFFGLLLFIYYMCKGSDATNRYGVNPNNEEVVFEHCQ
ncbi:DUF805 domain-containing protein [Pelistega sp. MC2]|uniref:DUF805 domain-containing protein n=1 Tax=Pelistega sp. MC2 TaxID=1720297 RepID=UPI0008D904FA|nr:DUF805 domain-containing protein [Pelistega sp. MC2]